MSIKGRETVSCGGLDKTYYVLLEMLKVLVYMQGRVPLFGLFFYDILFTWSCTLLLVLLALLLGLAALTFSGLVRV